MFEGTILETLTEALVSFLITVIDLLPDSPFTFLDTFEQPASVVMSYVNWFVDFPTMYNITLLWIGCVLGWYVYRMILNWVHLAGG